MGFAFNLALSVQFALILHRLAAYTGYKSDPTSMCTTSLQRVFMKFEHNFQWSGRQDSNLRPTVPKTVALPGCATPRLACLLTSSQKIGKRKDRFKRAIWPETVRNRHNVDRRRVQCSDARCDPPLICHILPRFRQLLPKHIEYPIPHQSTLSRTGLHYA